MARFVLWHEKPHLYGNIWPSLVGKEPDILFPMARAFPMQNEVTIAFENKVKCHPKGEPIWNVSCIHTSRHTYIESPSLTTIINCGVLDPNDNKNKCSW